MIDEEIFNHTLTKEELIKLGSSLVDLLNNTEDFVIIKKLSKEKYLEEGIDVFDLVKAFYIIQCFKQYPLVNNEYEYESPKKLARMIIKLLFDCILKNNFIFDKEEFKNNNIFYTKDKIDEIYKFLNCDIIADEGEYFDINDKNEDFISDLKKIQEKIQTEETKEIVDKLENEQFD